MKTYRLVFREVDRDKFNEIAHNLKTIETRAATVKYRPIKVGDKLIFVCGADSITKSVRGVERFDSLEQMFEKLPMASILPSAKTLDEAKKIYYSFPGYKEKIESAGILAFSLAQ